MRTSSLRRLPLLLIIAIVAIFLSVESSGSRLRIPSTLGSSGSVVEVIATSELLVCLRICRCLHRLSVHSVTVDQLSLVYVFPAVSQ